MIILSALIKLLEGVNWTGIIAVINLGAILSIIRIITSLHKKQIEHLEAIKQSEFAKEIQSFRVFYEEKKIMIEHEKTKIAEEAKEHIANVELRMHEAEENLTKIVNELELSKSENEKLNSALNRSIISNNKFTSDIVSHELRQGLNAILSDCEYILLKHKHIPGLTEKIEDVKNETLSLSYIIKRIRVPFYETLPSQTKSNLSINRYLSKVLPVIDLVARQKNNKINISYSNKNDSTVVFDSELLELVLFETISNAIRYSKDGESVNIFNSIENNFLVITISNVLPEKSSDEISRIFDMGFRGKTAVKYSISGAGLGLWITKHALDKFGGKINVSTSDDTFMVKIYLPRL